MKKINCNFPLHTGLKTEDDALDNFNKRFNIDDRELTRWAIFSNSIAFFAGIVLAVAVSILLVAYNAPAWVVTCFCLALIGVLLFMWAAAFDVRSANRSRAK